MFRGRERKAIEVRIVGAADDARVDYIIPEIIISGNTYPIRSQLESMRFRWIPGDKTWRYNTTDRGTISSVVDQVMCSGDCRIVNAWVEGLCAHS